MCPVTLGITMATHGEGGAHEGGHMVLRIWTWGSMHVSQALHTI